jgi:RimJ/RimL family protein N-acetyltransferase
MKTVIETKRLRLREYTEDDFAWLYAILSDEETMRYYPRPYDERGTARWIGWCLDCYRRYGFGLWAIECKESGEMIGDCGISMQNIDGEQLPEIGYHIRKEYWRKGYGKEAAAAVRDWAFTHTKYDRMYSYMKYTNLASSATAQAIGMTKVKEYADNVNGISFVYAMTKDQWNEMKKSQVI